MPLDFNELAEREGDARNLIANGTIKKEMLHYDILLALHKTGLLANLTFKGGTSLRLCHGSPRLSEDLDFAGGASFSLSSFAPFGEVIADDIHRRYGLRTFVKLASAKQLGMRTPVCRLWVAVETHPGRPDMPRQRVKIEVDRTDSAPTEINEPNLNYRHLGPEYETVKLRTVTMESVMADKLVALPMSVVQRNNPRYRDIWDLDWLATRRGCRPAQGLIATTVAETGVEEYSAALRHTLDALPEIVSAKAYSDALRRHLRFKDWESTVSPDSRAATISKLASLLRECEAAIGQPP